MAESTAHSNTVRAGAFLLTAAVLGLAVVVVLAKFNILGRTHRYTVRFQMGDGVAGLEKGAEVRVAGLTVGSVERIHSQFDQGYVDVLIGVDSSIAIHKDAVVLRAQPLLGNVSWLNFTSLGTPEAGEVPEGGTLDATPSSGLLATIVGPQNARHANRMFDDLAAFTDALADFARVQYPQSVRPLLQNVASITADARQDYAVWRKDITHTLQAAASASAKLDTSMDDILVVAQDARQLTQHLRQHNLKQIDDILDNADRSMTSLANALQSVEELIATNRGGIEAALTDLRTAATQVKLSTMEVRRSPWKLLYQPGAGELARENLYEAARAFAIASSDLRAAGETLKSVLSSTPERFENDESFRQAVQQYVTGSLTRFEAAQQRLFDVLLDGKTPPTGSEQAERPISLPMPGQ